MSPSVTPERPLLSVFIAHVLTKTLKLWNILESLHVWMVGQADKIMMGCQVNVPRVYDLWLRYIRVDIRKYIIYHPKYNQ